MEIAVGLRTGESISAIAKRLGRHDSTISKEIKLNSIVVDGELFYEPETAQQRTEARFKALKNGSKKNDRTKEYIQQRLLNFHSPEAIASELKKEKDVVAVGFKTIYRWIKEGYLDIGDMKSQVLLRRKGKKYQRRQLGKVSSKKSIHTRPKVVEKRCRLGDFEADTIVSAKNGTACLVTLVCRASGYLMAKMVPQRTSKLVGDALISMLKHCTVHTITTDNGTEFADYERVEKKLKAEFYFADPYASWQRGSNENTNGLLRYFFPKGTDFSQLSKGLLKMAVDMINKRPMKRHGWKSREHVYHLLI